MCIFHIKTSLARKPLSFMKSLFNEMSLNFNFTYRMTWSRHSTFIYALQTLWKLSICPFSQVVGSSQYGTLSHHTAAASRFGIILYLLSGQYLWQEMAKSKHTGCSTILCPLWIIIQNTKAWRVLKNSCAYRCKFPEFFNTLPTSAFWMNINWQKSKRKVSPVLWDTLYVYFWPLLVILIVHSIVKVWSRIGWPLLARCVNYGRWQEAEFSRQVPIHS